MDKHRDPFFIPPLMIRIITSVTLIVGVTGFSIFALLAGDLMGIFYGILFGLALVPVVLIWLLIQRFILWFYFMFFWYVQGFFAALILLGLVVTACLFTFAAPQTRVATPIFSFRPEFSVLWILMALLGAGVLAYAWFGKIAPSDDGADEPPRSIKKRQPDTVDDIIRKRKERIERDLE